MAEARKTRRWSARPLEAALVRGLIFLAPIAASLAFVHLASRVVPMPTSSFWLFLLWWIALSGLATGVLVLGDRLSRRLLPLVALLKLSLIFPDRAPSRFRLAMRTGTVETLEGRIAKATAGGGDTPVAAAERLLQLVAALDVHDSLTRGHAERVRAYTQMIAEELRLGKKERDLLNWSALLHDVGKLQISSEILTKPGGLTAEQYEAVKRHPELGEDLVAPLRSWLGEWSDAVGDHHERWDGQGYPRGKAGEEISFGGRIVAVADVFDVITSARSYKEASNAMDARNELARNAGTQFDERMVRAFLGISLGRLRLAMGPLAWLAHAPVLGRIPLTPAVSSLSGALAVVAASVTTGLVAEAAPGRAESSPPSVSREATPATPEPGGRSPGQTRVPEPAGSSPPVPPAQTTTAEEPGAEPPSHPASVALAPHVEASIDEDSTAVVPIDGITDADDVAGVRVSAPPHVGEASATTEHALFYRPPADYHGRTLIGYEVCWRDERCALGEARIVVRPVNDAPEVTDDGAKVDEDDSAVIDVLANDSDVDGESLRLSSVSGETRGEAVVRDGRVAWSPPTNFNGWASFAYVAVDPNGAKATGRVRVTVEPVNDAPHAAADTASTNEDRSVRIPVLENDSDPEADRLEVVDVAKPRRGSVKHDATSVTYVPPPDFFGTATFTYRSSDGDGGQASGEVEVSIDPVNDAPRAGNDIVSVLENESLTIDVLANDGDPEGNALSLASFEQPSLGTVTRDGDRLRFAAPATGGSASVDYVVRDAHGAADVGTVFITVIGVNTAPSFAPGGDQVVAEDSGTRSVAPWAQSITAGPADETFQNVTFILTNTNSGLFTAGGQPALSGDGTLTYTPAPNAVGSASVTVRARDDGGTANGGSDTSAPHAFTITVTNVNDPPAAASDTASVDEDSPGVTFSVLANDTDADAADPLTVTSYDSSGVTNGMLTHNGPGSFTFVPEAGYHGSQSFSYTISDGNGGFATAGVTIVVTPQPDAPVAADDAYATTQNTPLNRPAPGVLANDGDEDGDPLTVQTTPVSPPSNGTVNLSTDGSFLYTPNAGFLGTDAFTYRVSDGTGRTDDAVVTITVSLVPTTLFYLGTSGASPDVWDLTTSPPPAASPVPDFDGDGHPGLTIATGSGNQNETDPSRWHAWARPISLLPLVLNGPVTLQLWSTIGGFDPDASGHPHVYLYDCLVGGLGCVKIAEHHQRVPDWNAGVADWVYREISLGSVNHTVLLGHELRVRVQSSENDLWIAMTAAYPSALAITGS